MRDRAQQRPCVDGRAIVGEMPKPPLVVIDGDSFAHRAYHGLRKTVRRPATMAGRSSASPTICCGSARQNGRPRSSSGGARLGSRRGASRNFRPTPRHFSGPGVPGSGPVPLRVFALLAVQDSIAEGMVDHHPPRAIRLPAQDGDRQRGRPPSEPSAVHFIRCRATSPATTTSCPPIGEVDPRCHEIRKTSGAVRRFRRPASRERPRRSRRARRSRKHTVEIAGRER